jgi:hypothetical protein
MSSEQILAAKKEAIQRKYWIADTCIAEALAKPGKAGLRAQQRAYEQRARALEEWNALFARPPEPGPNFCCGFCLGICFMVLLIALKLR